MFALNGALRVRIGLRCLLMLEREYLKGDVNGHICLDSGQANKQAHEAEEQSWMGRSLHFSPGQGRQLPTAYSNYVLREMGRAEAMLKVLGSQAHRGHSCAVQSTYVSTQGPRLRSKSHTCTISEHIYRQISQHVAFGEF
eukprot:1640749-Amphidinium_carterae.1